jgi:hypothetical protein
MSVGEMLYVVGALVAVMVICSLPMLGSGQTTATTLQPGVNCTPSFARGADDRAANVGGIDRREQNGHRPRRQSV